MEEGREVVGRAGSRGGGRCPTGRVKVGRMAGAS